MYRAPRDTDTRNGKHRSDKGNEIFSSTLKSKIIASKLFGEDYENF